MISSGPILTTLEAHQGRVAHVPETSGAGSERTRERTGSALSAAFADPSRTSKASARLPAGESVNLGPGGRRRAGAKPPPPPLSRVVPPHAEQRLLPIVVEGDAAAFAADPAEPASTLIETTRGRITIRGALSPEQLAAVVAELVRGC